MPAWQGGWSDLFGANHTLLINRNPRRNNIRRTMNRDSFRAVTELFDTLIGASAGGTALATHRKVGHVPVVPTEVGALGGARQVEVITSINRVSTAADVTALKEMVFNVRTRPATYARDLSGNGGPSF